MMRVFRRCAVLVALHILFAGVSPSRAQPAVAAGGEFQVNTYTTSSQIFPSVSADFDGDFVVVWASDGSSGSDASGYSVQGQRYAANGTPLGGEFQVNTYTAGTQTSPVVALDQDGDFVVVWQSAGSSGTDSSGYSVQGRVYKADGTPLTGEFQVNTYTTGHQSAPSVSVDADGDFVAVWTSFGSGGTDSSGYSVQGQRYAADGTPLGDQFQVNTYTTSAQRSPAVSLDPSGDFVVVWTSDGSSGSDLSGLSIQGQLFASDGTPQASQFQVNSITTSSQRYPSVSRAPGGGFVVVWSGAALASGDPSASSVQAQRYSPAGTPQGSEFQVNTFTTSDQTQPAVSTDGDGDFVVAWTNYGSTTDDPFAPSISGQGFAAGGATDGGEFQVNTYITSFQSRPSISVDDAGDFVVVWHSYGSSGTDSSGWSIQGQRYEGATFKLFVAEAETDPAKAEESARKASPAPTPPLEP